MKIDLELVRWVQLIGDERRNKGKRSDREIEINITMVPGQHMKQTHKRANHGLLKKRNEQKLESH